MLFPEQWSNVIENADAPVSLIANLPDFVELTLVSLNFIGTRGPALTIPKS